MRAIVAVVLEETGEVVAVMDKFGAGVETKLVASLFAFVGVQGPGRQSYLAEWRTHHRQPQRN